MKPEKRSEMESNSRSWALENYSIETNGKKIQDFIDSLPILEDLVFEYATKKKNYNPSAQIPHIESPKDWVKKLYKDILDMEVTDQDSGLLSWIQNLESGLPRQQVLQFFIKTAQDKIAEEGPKENITEQLDRVFSITDKKKVLITIKESLGDIVLITALLEDFRRKYPAENYFLFLATETKYFDVLNGNPYIDKIIPWHPVLENELFLIGAAGTKRFVDHFYYPAVQTQKFISYLSGK